MEVSSPGIYGKSHSKTLLTISFAEGKENHQGADTLSLILTHCEGFARQVSRMGVLREKPRHSFSQVHGCLNASSVPRAVLDAVDLAVDAAGRFPPINELSLEELTVISHPRNWLHGYLPAGTQTSLALRPLLAGLHFGCCCL